jgi:hypothetical protein
MTLMPHVGMHKASLGEETRTWCVAMGSYHWTPEEARQFAAELLNAADDVDRRRIEDEVCS